MKDYDSVSGITNPLYNQIADLERQLKSQERTCDWQKEVIKQRDGVIQEKDAENKRLKDALEFIARKDSLEPYYGVCIEVAQQALKGMKE